MAVQVPRECSLWSKTDVEHLLSGISLFDSRNPDRTDTITEEKQEFRSTKNLSNLSISEKKTCNTCDLNFEIRDDQRLHFKSDWHRFNLRQRLRGRAVVSEETFDEEIQNLSDLSSISATDTESSDDEYIEETDLITDITIPVKKKEHIKAPSNRLPVILFQNHTGECFSLYKTVLYSTTHDETTGDICQAIQDLPNQVLWIVLLTSAGHFAAAVFEGADVVVHKTFHRYTVRAKRGTSQGMHDSQGKASKSAGANLRRYNEQALGQEIISLLGTWSEYIQKANRIFMRIPNYNKSTFFGGKQPIFTKNDDRISTIPFPTRRATFSEVKRVHKLLSTVKCYGTGFFKDKPLDTSDRESENVPQNDNMKTTTRSIENMDDKSENLDPIVNSDAPNKVRKRNRRKGKHQTSDKSSEISGHVEYGTACTENASISAHVESETACTETACTESDTISESCTKDEFTMLYNKVYTMCKTGDTDQLGSLLTECKEKCNINVIDLVAHCGGNSGNTLLHVAATSGHSGVIGLLLETGADPTISNTDKQVPYEVASSKAARDEFRRFMAKFPDRYDYDVAKIPGPLTQEMEQQRKLKEAAKRKAQKQAKRERTKDKREQEQTERQEDREKKKFTALSDREKRAIVAERRFIDQQQSTGSKLPVLSRCWSCGLDITGKIPFEYYDYKFCSTKCLRSHRDQSNSARQ